MKPFDNIEESVRGLRRSTTAETDERVLGDALAALEESTPSKAGGGRPAAKLAVAAVVIIGVLIGVGVFTGRGPRQEQEPQVVREVEEPRTESAAAEVEEARPAAAVKPVRAVTELEAGLMRIERMFAAGDVKGLVAALDEEEITGKLAAAIYLSKVGDLRAIGALERLSTEYGGDDAGNPFASAIRGIKERLEEERQAEIVRVRAAELAAAIKPGYIRGWLVDANDRPVRGEVTLGGPKVATAEDGAFTIREPTYTEFGSVFGRAFSAEGDLGRLFVWDKSYDVNDVVIIVEPPASVSGVVVDRNGSAVDDFELAISVFVTDDMVYQSSLGEMPWRSEIGAAGSFDIKSVPIGVGLELAVKKPGFKTTIRLEGLAAGRELELGQIVLEPLEGFSEDVRWDCVLTGLVVNEQNEPMGGAKITANAAEERFEILADEDGRYELQGLPEAIETRMVAYFDGYGYNTFYYTCSELSNELDIQMFPPAYYWYGKAAPGLFVEKWLNREPLGLEELRGRVVLLHVGIDLARYPKQTLRHLEQIKGILERYEGSGLVVITVHQRLDGGVSEDSIRRFIEEYDVNFAFGIDEDMYVVEDMMPPAERFFEDGRLGVRRGRLRNEGAMYSVYEVKAQPAYYLIDKEGILRISPAEGNLEEWVELLLAE